MAPEALPDTPEVVSDITLKGRRRHGLTYTYAAV